MIKMLRAAESEDSAGRVGQTRPPLNSHSEGRRVRLAAAAAVAPYQESRNSWRMSAVKDRRCWSWAAPT